MTDQSRQHLKVLEAVQNNYYFIDRLYIQFERNYTTKLCSYIRTYMYIRSYYRKPRCKTTMGDVLPWYCARPPINYA